jgi:hypothetical protein
MENQSDQHDFARLNNGLQVVGSELQKIQNIPSLAQGSQILSALQNLSDQMTNFQHQMTNHQHQMSNFQTEMQRKFNQMEINSAARLQNSWIRASNAPLMELVTLQGDTPSNFPPTLAALSEMNSEMVNTLLAEYSQPTDGTVAVKKTD